jgi:signal peptidase I
MKIISKITNVLFYFIVFIIIIAAIGSSIAKKPLLMSAVRSNSMYPLFQRGDMLLVSPVINKDNLRIGDIIFFKDNGGRYETQGWIVHRIVGGNITEGFITKGDNNDYTDQSERAGAVLVKPEFIGGKVFSIGLYPIKIPLLGHLPLIMEKYSKSPLLLPVIVFIIVAMLAFGELSKKKIKKQRKLKLEKQLIYFLSGVTVFVLALSTMLKSSQHFNIKYEVSKTSNGALLGSNVGILKLGQSFEKSLSAVSNSNFLPVIATITTDDNQIRLSHESLYLKKGDKIQATTTINASKIGSYNSTIHIGIFLPLLPQNVIHSLARKSYWLALIVVSIIPGLPLMLYPLIDSTLRRKTIKEIRRFWGRIRNKFSFGHY